MLLLADYILPISSSPIKKGALLVRDGVIVNIGSAESLLAHYPDEEVKDFGTAALMPGLVDLHTHLESSVLRGLIKDAPYVSWMADVIEKSVHMNALDWYHSAMLGGLEALQAGITCLADISATGAVFKAVNQLGLRSVIYREVGAMDKRRIDFALKQAYKDIDAWQEEASDLVNVGIAPAPLYVCNPAILKLVSKYAKEHNLPVALHVAASREEYDFIMRGTSTLAVHKNETPRGYLEIPPWLPAGVTPVNYALNWGAFDSGNVLALHCIHVTYEDIEKLKQRDVAIAICPRANAQLGMGQAPFDEYLRRGLRVGLGTDSPAATDSTDMLTEMRIGMLVQRAVNPRHFIDAHTMLEMATLGGARALKLDHRIGSLEVGKEADIIAVDLSGSHHDSSTDPVAMLVNTASASEVLMTMVAGKILYEQSQWQLDVNVVEHVSSAIGIRNKILSQS